MVRDLPFLRAVYANDVLMFITPILKVYDEEMCIVVGSAFIHIMARPYSALEQFKIEKAVLVSMTTTLNSCLNVMKTKHSIEDFRKQVLNGDEMKIICFNETWQFLQDINLT